MLTQILIPLLLLTGAAPSQQSALAQSDHVHSWRQIMESADVNAWIDSNWRSEIVHEGNSYPIFLIRAHMTMGDNNETQDQTLAFDCRNRRMALIALWLRPDEDAPRQVIEPDTIHFIKNTEGKDSSNDALFAAVCSTSPSE